MTHFETLVNIGSDIGASVAGKPYDIARRELVDCLLAVCRGFDDATDGNVLSCREVTQAIEGIGAPVAMAIA